MRSILSTRLLRWRNQWKSLIFWLLFPIIMTIGVMQGVGVWQEETKIPIALVVEEETELVTNLIKQIADAPLLHIHFLDLQDALYKLEKHELDSVFVIRNGYEDKIYSNRRNHLIEAYSSNRSFAYSAVSETITSFAQQDASRSKAAFVIKRLYADFDREEEWSWDEIIETSSERQAKEALLNTSFTYYNKALDVASESVSIVKVWGVWSFFSIVMTFFLFDWVLKENRVTMRSRWIYTTTTFKKYALSTLFLYTLLLFVIDLLTAYLFYLIFDEPIDSKLVIALLAFRITINVFAFLIANLFEQLFIYYVSTFALALFIVLIGGAVIPLDGMIKIFPWVEFISPVQAFLNLKVSLEWLGILSLMLMLWIWKGGKAIA